MRREHDFYPTPRWCVERLLERVPIVWWGASTMLEPAAGNGALVNAVNDFTAGPTWDVYEIREECRKDLFECEGVNSIHTTDWLEADIPDDVEYSAIITNPPYSLAEQFVWRALQWPACRVLMLLRLNFLGSAKRHKLFGQYMPNVYVLPNRPSFTADGRTDATEYAWFEWFPLLRGGRARTGCVEVLNTTPRGER